MSAVGIFQVYINDELRRRQAEEAEEQDEDPGPVTHDDTQVLHDDELWVTYRHGCG